ncbi:phosphoserine aminotransferase [Rickettsiales endosymbiont of Peranema trichophorum]|uniref:phosphoserine aminotransferase n=1 Tax=Rickettsiales endosymbiont of Peranema trichophorum TaxID=2486577 RepID=UPI0010238E55|nr:phosphoserine aminotransferase [Rickettsiales endosymbiont of Peranema trichophorum]RZI45614.1 phosphoserine aminotransferase [Rickettsiales endosymbiont of Peranema trichophorum]
MLQDRFAGHFSSGPARKFQGWNLSLLSDACVGRSHRSDLAKKKLKAVIDRTKTLLKLPEEFVLGIVTGSATGAVETAIWNLIGEVPVVCHVVDVFSQLWADDVIALPVDAKVLKPAQWGELPPLDYDAKADLIITLNASTSGTYYDDLSWIPTERNNLVIADATSSAFAIPVDYNKIDAYCFSWQKGLGGEAAHGMVALSKRALQKLERYTPEWAIPRLLKLKRDDKIHYPIFEGVITNTPSMLCVEDSIVCLDWAERVGGLDGMIAKSLHNLETLKKHVTQGEVFRFSSSTPSNTTPCIIVKAFEHMPMDEHFDILRRIASKVAGEGIAVDIVNHPSAFPAFRLWCGSTTESKDLDVLLPILAQEVKRYFE